MSDTRVDGLLFDFSRSTAANVVFEYTGAVTHGDLTYLIICGV
jgi:hypothetical protein